MQAWQDVLWREWRHTDDETYARHLFELVVAAPPYQWLAVILIIRGLIYGAVVGLLVGLITIIRAAETQPAQAQSNWLTLGAFTGVGSLIGGSTDLLAGLILKNPLAWYELSLRLRIGVIVGLIFWLLGGPFVGLTLGLIAGAGCISFAKWRAFDPLHFDPVSIGLVTGITVGLVVGLTFGGLAGLNDGLFIGLLSWPVITIPLLLHGPSKTMTKLFAQLRKVIIGYENRPISLPEQFLQYNHRKWYFWWQNQPKMAEVERSLREACLTYPNVRKTWAGILQGLEEQKQCPDPPDQLFTDLQSDNWRQRFIACHALMAQEGEAVATLQAAAADRTVFKASPISHQVMRVLKNIEIETTARLAKQASVLLCPRCIVHCCRHQVQLSWQPDLTYYGCRACNQSREFMEWSGAIVAVLDSSWNEALMQQDNLLQINWLKRGTLFDFDRVDIRQVTDEEVERFTLQVGNDTDIVRQPRYQQIRCTIASTCHLSANTLRILQRTFGEVECQLA